MANWITDEQLKNNTVIQQNVDSYLFDNDISFCQKSKIESCLTVEMVARIDAYISGAVDEDVETLVNDYIIPALSLHTFAAALPNIAIRVTNKGIFEKADNTNNNVGVSGVDYMARQYRERAEYYTNAMVTYLKDNIDLFPEMNADCADCSQKKGFNFNIDYISE